MDYDDEPEPEDLIEQAATPHRAEGTVTIDVAAIAASVEGMIIERTARLLSDRLFESIRHEVIEQLTPAIDAKLGALVEETVTRQFQPITAWGERDGEPTTLRDMLLKQAQNFIETTVNKDGEPCKDSWYKPVPRWQWYAQKVVTQTVQAELARETDAYMHSVKNRINTGLADLLTAKTK